MQAKLPLRITITRVTPNDAGSAECAYDIHDADDALVKSSHFTTAPHNVAEVSSYTVERLSASFAKAPLAPAMSPAARESLDQIISVTGISKGKKGKTL